jgi:hypothetical protein
MELSDFAPELGEMVYLTMELNTKCTGTETIFRLA